MEYEKLHFREPYLLQRGSINATEGTLSTAVRLQYMGSAEFEFGALPGSLSRMSRNRDGLLAHLATSITTHDGRSLAMFGLFSSERYGLPALEMREAEIQIYEKQILSIVDRKLRTKEYAAFEDQMQPFRPHYPRGCTTLIDKLNFEKQARARLTSFWWDIENDVMMSFDAGFMVKLPTILESSFAVMAENRLKSAAQSAAEPRPMG